MRRLLSLVVLGILVAAQPAAAQLQDLLERGGKVLGDPPPGSGDGAKRPAGTNLSAGDVTAGLKDALRVGTERVVGRLGRTDGFNKDPDIHIPLPGSLAAAQEALTRAGFSSYGEELELKLNRAAEAATPRAKTLFFDAISSMTLDDAKRILNGPRDAATRYFEGRMKDPLRVEMRPMIDATLSEVGAIGAYDAMIEQYKELPLVPDVKANLTDHALDKALAGLFHYLAVEEAAIRDDPARRTTELLKKVFGS